MERSVNRSLLSLLAVLLAAAVVVPEHAFADEVVEKVVVRNRKYQSLETFELNPMVGFSITNRMTSQTNFQLGLAYNLTENFALEARGGYAIGDLTSVGEQAREGVMNANPFLPTSNPTPDEFKDLWRLQWQALLMPRWTPIYGKLNLVTELPIHFQAYLSLGGGAVGLEQDSVVYCQNGTSSTGDGRSSQCGGYLKEDRITWALAGGGGFRFMIVDDVWAFEQIALRLELFDIAYPDEYRKNIDRKASEQERPGDPPGQGTVTGAGLTNVLFFNAGLSVAF